MGSKRPPPSPHVLVLPLPSPGHINPMLSFSTHLSLRGVIITFINTTKAQERINLNTTPITPSPHDLPPDDPSMPIPDIRFHTIAGPYQEPGPPGTTMDPSQFASLLATIASQCHVIEDLIVDSRSSVHPITCIVSDPFFPWTQPLADKLGIQRILFWTTNGLSLASITELRSPHFRFPDLNGPMEGDIVLGGVKLNALRFLTSTPIFRDPTLFSSFKARLDGIEKTTCIVVNTFEELEDSSLKATMCETPMRYIGPLAPPLENNATISANFFREETESLNWLDKQEPGSVIYISFGSVVSLAQDQIHELASGVEASKQPFLWVVRDSITSIPEGFIERTYARGLVIKWAPQLRVLSHPSVGGFLTHCGWNSTLESIHAGVPMLCFPVFGDQHLNALLVEDVWKLGVSLSKGFKDGGIVGDEVEKGIVTLMRSDDIKERASRWKICSHQAIQQGGTSNLAMESIILDLMKGVTM